MENLSDNYAFLFSTERSCQHIIIRITTAIIVLLTSTWAISNEITIESLQERGVLVHPIGNDELLCVINTHSEDGARWFLLQGRHHNSEIGSNLSALHDVYQLMASPNYKYLAILSAGEGHPLIEIIELQTLRDQKKYTILHEIDPYPGTVWISAWENQRLIVESDVPLTLRKKDGRVDPNLLMPEVRRFALNTASGQIESIDFEITDLIQYYVTNLTDKQSSRRIEAAYALKALAYTPSLSTLEMLLRQEKHPDVIKAFQKAIKALQIMSTPSNGSS